jgi:lysozyme
MMKRIPIIAACGAIALALVAATPAFAVKGGHGGHGGATYLQGVDVSHWNGTINWSAVAADHQSFAIAKVTEGQTFLDNMYATNKAGAMAAGLKFTAYHFARPDTASQDAIKEADWFVSQAGLTHGNLVPALDLEVNGGLSVATLTSWVQAWLAEVGTKMGGVHAMIYTSPSFWQTSMGNTTWFADNGYRILWIAHWTSNSSPSVPAGNWAGLSWTFWQWTDCTHVNGISGCVDGDRYHWTDNFAQVLIP